jgi:hypothetical protein
MTREALARWLEDYVDAWRSNERERIVALFTADVSYRYYPHEPAVVGAEAVADAWLEKPDDPGSWRASYSPFAVDGDTGVAIGESVYFDAAGSVTEAYDNCFLIEFAADGRCSRFTEYYVKRPPG